MMTCSSSGRSRITSATSAGGHSRNTSRSAPKLRASIMLLISGSKILPTIRGVFTRERRRVLTPRLAERNRPLSFPEVAEWSERASDIDGNAARVVASESRDERVNRRLCLRLARSEERRGGKRGGGGGART